MCLHVHYEALVPVLIVDLLLDVCKGGHACPAGVRYDDIYATHSVERLFDEVLYGGLGGHVGLDEVEAWVGLGGAALDGRELIHEGLCAFGV